MNEHIKNELVRRFVNEADIWCDQNCLGSFEEYANIWNEKLVEFVVKECANIAWDHWLEDKESSAQFPILKHFGLDK